MPSSGGYPPPPVPQFHSPYPGFYPPYGFPPVPPPPAPIFNWGDAPPPPPDPDVVKTEDSSPYTQEEDTPYQDGTQSLENTSVTPEEKIPKDLTEHLLETAQKAAVSVAKSASNVLGDLSEEALAADLMQTSAGSYHLGWTNHWLTSMPPEVLMMCKPLHCELCECHATSPLQAKMHYEGRIHDKHIRSFFATWEGNFRNIVPEKHPDFDFRKNKPSVDNRAHLHCDVCHIYFTSEPQLEQHLAGRNHQRLAVGLSGLKPGYYNDETHKWQRFPPNEETGESTEYSQQDMTYPSDGGNKLWCELCKVGAPTQAQMDMHLNGKSHRSKMKRGFEGVEPTDLETIKKRVRLKENILSKVSRKALMGRSDVRSRPFGGGGQRRRPQDLSAFRTPSGQYYCPACNLSVNSEPQFAQHQVSKKHKLADSAYKFKKSQN